MPMKLFQCYTIMDVVLMHLLFDLFTSSKCWLNCFSITQNRTFCKTESKSGPLILKHHATQYGCYLKEKKLEHPPNVIFWHFKVPHIPSKKKLKAPQFLLHPPPPPFQLKLWLVPYPGSRGLFKRSCPRSPSLTIVDSPLEFHPI